MDAFLVILGFFFSILGLAGSFLPVLPGPPLGWIGLLLLYLTQAVPDNWILITACGVVALGAVILDYVIPAMGTKRFGGSRAGMIGATLGLILALVFPIFGVFGIVIWPFIGALAGELINNAGTGKALKAAVGSFIGFLTGTFLKFVVSVVFLGIFIYQSSRYISDWVPW